MTAITTFGHDFCFSFRVVWNLVPYVHAILFALLLLLAMAFSIIEFRKKLICILPFFLIEAVFIFASYIGFTAEIALVLTFFTTSTIASRIVSGIFLAGCALAVGMAFRCYYLSEKKQPPKERGELL